MQEKIKGYEKERRWQIAARLDTIKYFEAESKRLGISTCRLAAICLDYAAEHKWKLTITPTHEP